MIYKGEGRFNVLVQAVIATGVNRFPFTLPRNDRVNSYTVYYQNDTEDSHELQRPGFCH